MEFKFRVFVFLKKRYIYVFAILLAALYLLYTYVLLRSGFFAANAWFGPFIMFLVFLIIASAYRLSVSRIYARFKSILWERCDPEEYLRISRYIIHSLRRKKRPLNFSYFLDYAAGLIAAGRFSDALDVLRSVKGFGGGKKGVAGTVEYFDELCETCLGLGKTDKAREAYSNLEKSFARLIPGRDISGSFRFYSKSVLIKMALGNFKGAEKFFVSMFERARYGRERAFSKYYLGEVYLHNGDKARAKEAFEYTAANGNKLFIAGEAKRKLGLINPADNSV